MKSIRCFVILAAALMLLLCSCSSTETEALPKTLRSADKKVSVSVPEGWSEYETEIKDNLVLAVQGGNGALAQIFWYPSVEGKSLTAEDYADEAQGYYGDDVTGSADEVELKSGDKGYFFAYEKLQQDTTFQGYEYFIDFTSGVVEVDIFYQYTDNAPSNDELLELRDIAETVRISA
jgi:hypothetical protein